MEGKKRRTEIRSAVDRVNAEGVPKDPEEVEGYFMEEVAEGERLCQDGEFDYVGVAVGLCGRFTKFLLVGCRKGMRDKDLMDQLWPGNGNCSLALLA